MAMIGQVGRGLRPPPQSVPMQADLPLDGNRLSYVLSAGRTGTTFLAHVLPGIAPSLAIRQEPPGSRPLFMLMNAALAGLAPMRWSERIYLADRRRWLRRLPSGQRIAEISPFILSLAPRFGELVRPLRVVHMVRDPRDWIQSMGNFKAWGWKRHVIDYVPFARPVHPDARRQWLGLDSHSKHAWWWRMANEQIEACRAACESYALIRYEDLFSSDATLRERMLRQVVAVLDPGAAPDLSSVPWNLAVNPGGRGTFSGWRGWSDQAKANVAAILAGSMARYGYGGEPEWPSS